MSTESFTSNFRPIAKAAQGLPALLIAAVSLAMGYYLSRRGYDLPPLLADWSALWLSPAALLAYGLWRNRAQAWNRLFIATFALALAAIGALNLQPGISNLLLAFFCVGAFAQQTGQGRIRLVNAVLRHVAGWFKALFFSTFGLPVTLYSFWSGLKYKPSKLRSQDMVLPVLAVAAFTWLLADANPLIELALNSISLQWLVNLIPVAFFWASLFSLICVLGISVGMGLRPDFGDGLLAKKLPGVGLIGHSSVLFTLLAMNGLFLVENLTDAAVLWSGRGLPEHMTYAEYAHRGAYALIFTSILAAALINFVMRPGSDNERSPLLRALTFGWIGQNLILAASTIIRVMNYVDAYGWTFMRLSALVWLGLVATGFCLIAFRLWQRRDSIWLMEANTWAVIISLLVTGPFDFDAITRNWNDTHWLTNAQNIQYRTE